MLMAETVHLSVKVSERFFSIEDYGMIGMTVHCTPEAVATHGSTDPNVLSVLIEQHIMILVSYKGEKWVGNSLSWEVTIMALVSGLPQDEE